MQIELAVDPRGWPFQCRGEEYCPGLERLLISILPHHLGSVDLAQRLLHPATIPDNHS